MPNEEEEKKQEEDPCKSTEYKITDGTCKPLTECNPNEEYESVAPTETSDRECVKKSGSEKTLI